MQQGPAETRGTKKETVNSCTHPAFNDEHKLTTHPMWNIQCKYPTTVKGIELLIYNPSPTKSPGPDSFTGEFWWSNT